MALHPTLAGLIDSVRLQGVPALSSGSPDDARALLAKSCLALGAGPQVGVVSDISIPARSGTVPARLFRAQEQESALMVYVHGGGWVIGSLDDFDALARTLVDRSGCALLLVDYRLAPEHGFPAGLEDVEDALRWAAENTGELLGQHVPLMVGGDSSGANLAISAVNSLRNDVNIALQVLFYPVTDSDFNTASYLSCAEGFLLTRADMQWFFGHYASQELWTDPRISPLRTSNLQGIAPAWIATAEYDVLRDEGEAYADRLSDVGALDGHRRYNGMTHGFVRMMNILDVAQEAINDAAVAMRQAASRAATRRTSHLP